MKLPNKSLEFLRDVLAAPGWVKGDNGPKKAKFAYEAGKLLSEVLPEPLTLPPTITDGESRASFAARSEPWNSAFDTPDFTLTPKQTEACRMAISFFFEDDKMPKGKYSNLLVDEFHVLED
jgi:hypothetical protein